MWSDGVLLTTQQSLNLFRALQNEGFADSDVKETNFGPAKRLDSNLLIRILLSEKAVVCNAGEALKYYDVSKAVSNDIITLASEQKSQSRINRISRIYDSVRDHGHQARHTLVEQRPMIPGLDIGYDETEASRTMRSDHLEGLSGMTDALDSISLESIKMLHDALLLSPETVNSTYHFFLDALFDLARKHYYGLIPNDRLTPQNKSIEYAERLARFSGDSDLSYLGEALGIIKNLDSVMFSNNSDDEAEDVLMLAIGSNASDVESALYAIAYWRTMLEFTQIGNMIGDESKDYCLTGWHECDDRTPSEGSLSKAVRLYEDLASINSVIPMPQTINQVIQIKESPGYERFKEKLKNWSSLTPADGADALNEANSEIRDALQQLARLEKITTWLGGISCVLTVGAIAETIATGTFFASIADATLIAPQVLLSKKSSQFNWIRLTNLP